MFGFSPKISVGFGRFFGFVCLGQPKNRPQKARLQFAKTDPKNRPNFGFRLSVQNTGDISDTCDTEYNHSGFPGILNVLLYTNKIRVLFIHSTVSYVDVIRECSRGKHTHNTQRRQAVNYEIAAKYIFSLRCVRCAHARCFKSYRKFREIGNRVPGIICVTIAPKRHTLTSRQTT